MKNRIFLLFALVALLRSQLINSQVKLAEGALSAVDAETLKAFVAAGGNVDSPQEYSEVSAIVSK